MKTRWNVSGRRTAIGAVTLMACMVLVMLGAAPLHADKHEETVMESVGKLLSRDARSRNHAVDGILQDRKLTIEKLIPLIDPANTENYTDETRCAAAYLLGELRAVEAVPGLSRALADEPGPKLIKDGSRFYVPVRTALVKIGRPAVPVMIENIETSDNRIVRIKSMDVLVRVLGGKRRVLELMDKLEARAAGNEQKIRRIREAAQRGRERWKGDREPLY